MISNNKEKKGVEKERGGEQGKKRGMREKGRILLEEYGTGETITVLMRTIVHVLIQGKGRDELEGVGCMSARVSDEEKQSHRTLYLS